MIIPKPNKIDKHAVGCIITYKNRYLLLHRTKDNFWNSVSGLPNSNESFKYAIKREIKEETNLDINPKFFKTTYHKYNKENIAYHLFTYNLKKDPTNKIKLNKESGKFGLFTLNQALKLNLFEDEGYCLKLHNKTRKLNAISRRL